jgi:uncharacterized membrane protein
MHGQRDDKAQHTVHRLEAFSDIVIGFSLAQLGLNLVLPKAPSDLTAVWTNVAFFIGAFFFIALLWWLHHRTFSTFFVLNTPMILLNFALLCALILALYFLESVVHVSASGQKATVFFDLFAFTFAVVYALLGCMLLAGLLTRRTELPASDIRWGIAQLVSIAIAGSFFVYAGAYSMMNAPHGALVYVAVAAALITFVVRRVILPRWLRQTVPETPGMP